MLRLVQMPNLAFLCYSVAIRLCQFQPWFILSVIGVCGLNSLITTTFSRDKEPCFTRFSKGPAVRRRTAGIGVSFCSGTGACFAILFCALSHLLLSPVVAKGC